MDIIYKTWLREEIILPSYKIYTVDIPKLGIILSYLEVTLLIYSNHFLNLSYRSIVTLVSSVWKLHYIWVQYVPNESPFVINIDEKTSSSTGISYKSLILRSYFSINHSRQELATTWFVMPQQSLIMISWCSLAASHLLIFSGTQRFGYNRFSLIMILSRILSCWDLALIVVTLLPPLFLGYLKILQYPISISLIEPDHKTL